MGTGQSPPSAESTGKAIVSALNPKKVVMVFTNHDKLGETGKKTGWYLPEAAHPYEVFHESGFSVTFASPKGGAVPVDPGSVDASKEDEVCMRFMDDKRMQDKLQATIPLKDVKSSDFDAVFYVGGHGTMFDFPDDENVQRVTKEIYEQGGIVSALCHGPIAL